MASIIKRTYKATTPDGKTLVKTCDHYTIQYRDAAGKIRRVKGYKDKSATKQLAAQLERRLARGEQGLVDPSRAHKARALMEHVSDWVADLRASGRAEKYVRNVNWRMKLLITGCGWQALADVEPNAPATGRASRRIRSRRRRRRLPSTSGAGWLRRSCRRLFPRPRRRPGVPRWVEIPMTWTG